jgi:hypothetical protein
MSQTGRKTWVGLTASMTAVNAALVGALTVLSFDPQRAAFGRATGLWHRCLPSVGGGEGYERWSPELLVLLLPAVVGLVIATRHRGSAAVILGIVSAILGLAAVAFVLVSTGTCIS